MQPETSAERTDSTNAKAAALRERQFAFLRAIQKFSEDAQIGAIIEKNKQQIVSIIIRSLQAWKSGHYEIKDRKAVECWLPPPPPRALDGNAEKRSYDWRNWDVVDATKHLETSLAQDLDLIRYSCEELIDKEGIMNPTLEQVVSSLRDISLRQVRNTPITIDNVSNLLSSQDIGFTKQDAYLSSFREDLLASTVILHEKSRLRTFLQTISSAVERSGLFKAIDELFTKKMQ